MAITTKAGNIVITGMKDFLVKTKTAPKTVIGDFDTIIDISLNDTEAKSELKCGYGAPTRMVIYGNRETTFDMTLGSFSTNLLRVMTGNASVIKSKAIDVINSKLIVTSSTTTLTKGVPSVGKPITVYVCDNYGRPNTLLIAGTPASDPAAYSISGLIVTVNVAVTNNITVYYQTDKTVESIESKDSAHPIYEMTSIIVCTDMDSGLIYRGTLTIPSGMIATSYNLTGKNTSDLPDNQKIQVTCLKDTSVEYPYVLDLEEVVNVNF